MPSFRALKILSKYHDITRKIEFLKTIMRRTMVRDRDVQAPPRNFRLFWKPNKISTQILPPQKYLLKFPA